MLVASPDVARPCTVDRLCEFVSILASEARMLDVGHVTGQASGEQCRTFGGIAILGVSILSRLIGDELARQVLRHLRHVLRLAVLLLRRTLLRGHGVTSRGSLRALVRL